MYTIEYLKSKEKNELYDILYGLLDRKSRILNERANRIQIISKILDTQNLLEYAQRDVRE